MPKFFKELMKCAAMKKRLLEKEDYEQIARVEEIGKFEDEIFSPEV